MAYKSNRDVEWIDRMNRKLTQTEDGADRLSRWLMIGFALLCLSVSVAGLSMAVAGSDFGHYIAFVGFLMGLFATRAFHSALFARDELDERETLIAWKSVGVGGSVVAIGLAMWMVANGVGGGSGLWIPASGSQWMALSYASLAAMQAVASITATVLTPPYLAESEDEYL